MGMVRMDDDNGRWHAGVTGMGPFTFRLSAPSRSNPTASHGYSYGHVEGEKLFYSTFYFFFLFSL